jgi:carbonic anhydrase/acetyltransferase-like protein (isoleucine patch superfamily)
MRSMGCTIAGGSLIRMGAVVLNGARIGADAWWGRGRW